jgi:hypothetical protein
VTGDAEQELLELRTQVALLRAERQASSELAESLDQLATAVEQAPRVLGLDDLRMRQLRALNEIWQVVSQFDLARWDPERTLGAIAKVLPPDALAKIVASARRGLA